MPRDVRQYEGSDKRRREAGRRVDPHATRPAPKPEPPPPPPEPRGSLL